MSKHTNAKTIAHHSTITHCARCGKTHVNLAFAKMEIPVTDADGTVWTHWAICPVSGDPVLQRITPDVVKTGA